MPMAPFSENYSKGTHFSDGVRVGPIYPTTYTPNPAIGGNFQTPVFVETPADQLRYPGVLLGPEVIYSITPYKAQNDALSPTAGLNLTASGLFTLQNNYTANTSAALGANPGGVSRVTLQSPIVSGITDPNGQQTFTQAFVFDVPRCVSVTSLLINAKPITLTAYGIDQYGFYVYSAITLPNPTVSNTTMIFPKAMKALLGVYCSGPMTSTAMLTFGTSDVYGLPYRVDNPSSIFPISGGIPLYTSAGTVLTGLQTLVASPINTQLNALLPLGWTSSCINAASPSLYSVQTPAPISSATTGDVRGLICIPGYEGTASSIAVPKSTYYSALSIGSGVNLNIRLYVPGALATKPGLRAPSATGAGIFGPGYPVLVPPYSGAPECIPLDVPTLPVDLYGSPQYWPL